MNEKARKEYKVCHVVLFFFLMLKQEVLNIWVKASGMVIVWTGSKF